MNTERVTRARARTLAAAGETPSLSALPDKTPARTARTTRRKAAAAATPAAAAPGGEGVAPVVLFNLTNEQEGAAEATAPAAVPLAAAAPQEQPAPAARPDSPPSPGEDEQHPPAAAADEPPATPAHSMPPSPAPLAPGATPTGLGLSSLLPLSPLAAVALHSKTPAATPLGGVEANHSKIVSALHAAAQALGGDVSAAAAEGAQQPDLLFAGFGSPLKPATDSPKAALVSIGAAIPAAPSATSPASAALAVASPVAASVADMEADDATSGASPMGPGPDLERDLTLGDMVGTPFSSGLKESGEGSTPTFPPATACVAGSTPGAAAGATPGAAAVLMRTVQKAHPLTPARQVVLEEEEQDYIMKVEGESPTELRVAAEVEVVQQQHIAFTEAAAQEGGMGWAAGVEDPSAASAAAATKPRLASKVVVPSPGVFDPRSLRQLKREVTERLAAKQASLVQAEEAESECEDWDQYIGTMAVGDDLAEELGALSLEPGAHGPLRGLPTPVGTHVRFDDDGDVAAVSPRQKVFLRGLPQSQGTHIRFDD